MNREFAEQRSRKTCAIWTRRDRRAAPAATATRLRPDARTWIRYVRSSTTVASICEWAPSRSASARWSIPGWNSASTSSWNRTPSVTTSCWPSRQPREWPSSSSKCTSYSWTMRWVGAECEWHLHEPFSRLATFLLMTNSWSISNLIFLGENIEGHSLSRLINFQYYIRLRRYELKPYWSKIHLKVIKKYDWKN